MKIVFFPNWSVYGNEQKVFPSRLLVWIQIGYLLCPGFDNECVGYSEAARRREEKFIGEVTMHIYIFFVSNFR